MTEDHETVEAGGDDAPDVDVRHSRRPSMIWIFPIVALVIAIGLGVRSFLEKGVTISITFETADGLEAEKTKIKYRDVEIGLVNEVEVSPDATHIIVTAGIDRKARQHLTDRAQFWVVRPRIGLGGISGLGTLISGAYLAFDPGGGAPTKKIEFKGLELPPVKPSDAPGIKVVLIARALGSISIGSPVYYREIRVGQVEGYRLAGDFESVEINIFIDEPHHNLVRETTRFWDVSGISMSLGADGFSVKSESLAALIGGGIAFETPGGIASAPAAAPGSRYELHGDYGEIEDEAFTQKLVYLLRFDGSVRGLTVGAPVDLRGIQVGSVTDVSLDYDADAKEVWIPVLIKIEPGRIHGAGGDASGARETIATLVEHGMRAQLKTGSLLTGQLFVDLEFHPGTPGALVEDGEYLRLPTLPGTVEETLANVSKIVETISKLPLEKVVNDTDQAIQALDRFIANIDVELKPLLADTGTSLKRAEGVLQQAEKALNAVNDLIGEDSPITYDIARALEQLAASARSVRVLSAYLERHPEALLYGKGRSGGP